MNEQCVTREISLRWWCCRWKVMMMILWCLDLVADVCTTEQTVQQYIHINATKHLLHLHRLDALRV